MIQGDRLSLASDLLQWHRFRVFSAGGDHYAENTFPDEIRAGGAEPGGQQAIGGRRSASPLDVPKNGDAGLQAGELFELFRQTPGVPGVFGFERRQFLPGDSAFLLVARGEFALLRRAKNRLVFLAHRPFRYRDNAEVGAVMASTSDRGGDFFDIVRNLWNQHYVRAARQAGTESQPARPVPHDLRHDYPVMAVRGAVEPVDRLGGDVQRGGEAETGIGHRHVVINGFGEGDDVKPLFTEAQRILLRAPAPMQTNASSLNFL